MSYCVNGDFKEMWLWSWRSWVVIHCRNMFEHLYWCDFTKFFMIVSEMVFELSGCDRRRKLILNLKVKVIHLQNVWWPWKMSSFHPILWFQVKETETITVMATCTMKKIDWSCRYISSSQGNKFSIGANTLIIYISPPKINLVILISWFSRRSCSIIFQ